MNIQQKSSPIPEEKKDGKMCKAVNQNSTKENVKANRYIKRRSTSLVLF